jgi:hypothetical protein
MRRLKKAEFMSAARLAAIGFGFAVATLAVDLKPAAAQIAIDEPGTYRHRFANAYFPVKVGEFRRADLHRYDDEGRDVSANYNLRTPTGRLLVTVYIYPSPPLSEGSGGRASRREALCRQEFEEFRTYLSDQHGGAQPREDGRPIRVPEVNPGLSHRTVFQFDSFFGDRVQPVRAEAHYYCFVQDKWQVKYRITAPVAVDDPDAVEHFIRTGPWPGRPMPAAEPPRNESLLLTSR